MSLCSRCATTIDVPKLSSLHVSPKTQSLNPSPYSLRWFQTIGPFRVLTVALNLTCGGCGMQPHFHKVAPAPQSSHARQRHAAPATLHAYAKVGKCHPGFGSSIVPHNSSNGFLGCCMGNVSMYTSHSDC